MPEAVYDDGQRENFGGAHATGGFGEVHIAIDHSHIAKLFIEDKLPKQLTTPQQRQAYLHNLRQSLQKVITYYNPVKQHPYWSRLFAWPDKLIARFDGRPALGVRAPFSPLHDLEKPIDWTGHGYSDLQPEERGWWIARVAIAMKLARTLRFLQEHTLVHNDLSPKNVFGDGYTGEMTLIDCDGIVSPGTTLLRTALGTPGYIAPELLMKEDLQRQRGIIPEANFYTDDHALAVLLYQLLLFRHPMKGPKRNPNPDVDPDEEERWLFAEGATYIEDPVDTSNRLRGLVISAATLGPTIERLFQRAFVNGLRLGQPGQRPSGAEWEDALTCLFDRIVPCANPDCPQRFFAAPERPSSAFVCSLCKEELAGPPSIPYVVINSGEGGHQPAGNRVVVGWPGRELYGWHIDSSLSPTPKGVALPDVNPVARFEYDSASNTWYLLNLRIKQLAVGGNRVPVGTRIGLSDGMTLAASHMASARVDMSRHSTSRNAPIYSLPDINRDASQPWPLFNPTRADTSWELGQPITLARYFFNRDAYPVATITPSSQGARMAATGRELDGMRVFISHSHDDNTFCHGFVDALRTHGADVWYDEKGISAGAAWMRTIEHEIETRECFIVILTPSAWKSQWVQDEIGLAFSARRRIVPVSHKPTQATGFIRTRQWVDVVGLSPVAAVDRVVEMLTR